MTRQDRTSLVAGIAIVGFVAAVAFHYAIGVYVGHPWPANNFLFDPTDALNDFYNIYRPVQAGAPYSSPLSVYFPFAFLPLWVARFLPATPLLVAIVLGFLAAAAWWLHDGMPAMPRFQRPVMLAALTVGTYPVLFCIDRGNLEMLVFLFLCAFLWSVRKERWALAAVWLAAATATKAYPGVFVVLLLHRRQYRALLVYGALTLFFTFGSAALYPGGVHASLAQLSTNLSAFNEVYVNGYTGMQYNTSYFGVLRIANVVLDVFPAGQATRLLMPYALLCLAAFAALSAILVLRGGQLWQQVTLLTLVMLLFPQVSFDYKLVHLLLPLGLFLAAESGTRDGYYATLFGLLLIPKAYVMLRGHTAISVILNPLLMTALALPLLQECWRRAGFAAERTDEAIGRPTVPAVPGELAAP